MDVKPQSTFIKRKEKDYMSEGIKKTHNYNKSLRKKKTRKIKYESLYLMQVFSHKKILILEGKKKKKNWDGFKIEN